MKFTAIILLSACLTASANGISQNVTLSEKNSPLEKVFQEIKKQTGYVFFYNYSLLQKAKNVTLKLNDVTLEEALKLCFKEQPLDYVIENRTVIITEKTNSGNNANETNLPSAISITGKVTDENGNPLNGATVSIKGTQTATKTDANGNFTIEANEGQALVISYVGYVNKEIKIGNAANYSIELEVDIKSMEAVVVNKGYYTEKQKYSTSNIGTVKASEIAKQPVGNPLLALQGRIPGVVITQSTGVPGGGITVRIQGQNSLRGGNEPLYVIDGVPYTQQLMQNLSATYGGILGANGGSPLNFINPADIESIDVLKDADATSIYGSRAAAGAILITTKKGKSGKTRIIFNAQTGWGKVSNMLGLLNTSQYLEMRHEAKANDGLSILPTDYDINGTWDTTRYTNWQKELLGGTAKYTDLQFSISGGNNNTTFSIGTGYHKETTVFPGNLSDQKGSVRFNISNSSNNKKFIAQLSGLYLVDINNLIVSDLTLYAIRLSPNAPSLYNTDGSLNWARLPNGNSTWYNPLTYLTQKYKSKTNNLISNAILSYQLIKGLRIQSSFGYTNLNNNEIQIAAPTLYYAPEQRANATLYSYYGNGTISSWNVEPQVTYQINISKGKMEALLGSTLLQENRNNQRFLGIGYSNDILMGDIRAAGTVSVDGTLASKYRYNAIFGRLNYNWADKYILNLTARRDGSSRFGSENLFNNFGSIAGAWLFSNEPMIQKKLGFISFGKLRASYGTTGNDQIGDYQFMNLYNSTSVPMPYAGGTALSPVGIPNPYLQWEETKKLQMGIDLGFFNDRLLVNANFYHNRSSNQLQLYALPSLTGRSNLQINFPATIQNSGWEIMLSSENFRNKDFRWQTNINVTIPKNKLVAYPEIESSTAATTLVIGQPITITKVYQFLGVNPTTGLYQVNDINGNPTSTLGNDKAKTIFIDQTPKFYGGLQNNFQYKGFEIDALLQFVRKIGRNYFFGDKPGQFFSDANDLPGTNNQPIWVLDRWQKHGDVSTFQQYSSRYPSIVNTPYSLATQSEARYSDASYIRLKNISISWQFPEKWKQRLNLENAKMFVQGQNVFIITNYKGLDPETASISNLPPLRVITIGAQIIL